MGASGSKFKEEKESIQALVKELYSKPDLGEICETYIPVLESQLRKHLRIELVELHDTIIMVPQREGIDINAKYRKKEEICQKISQHYKRIIDLVRLIVSVYNIEENSPRMNIAEICLANTNLGKRQLEVTVCLEHRQFEIQGADGKLIRNSDSQRVDISSLVGLTEFVEALKDEKVAFLNSLQNLLGLHEKPFCSKMFKIPGCKTRPEHEPPGSASMSMKLHEQNPIFSNDLCQDRVKVFVTSDSPAWNEAKRLYRKLHEEYGNGLKGIKDVLQELLTGKGSLRSKTITLTEKELGALEHRAYELIMNFYFGSLTNYYNLMDLAIEQSEDSFWVGLMGKKPIAKIAV